MTRSKTLLFFLVAAGLGLGILCGRALRGEAMDEDMATGIAGKTSKRMRETGPSGRENAGKPVPEGVPSEGFVVPPQAMRRIQVELLSGSSLNKNECRMLGMTEAQIKEVDLMVSDAVKRWREREMATAKRIPSQKGDVLWFIPAAGPAVAEQEWLGVTKKLVEIGGPDLEPLLTYRLTVGNSPSHRSNSGAGMLNLLTAGFGTLDRFIKIPADGSYPQVIDVFPHRVKEVPVDESIFEQFEHKLSIDWRSYISPADHADRFSHLPATK
ncbi:hypothetical protein [Luteolibacter luteus]|uniref:Uncharacterized protein n=1 Tax=Luteolibacter luteus TaxID=2728835 RepID=A0A858RNT2_9BACT|nr:hypothetical protein [Luteolibacter luteus]QJE98522.1 hypothetical protein HHL09_22950 [Luteolibacter luteus]